MTQEIVYLRGEKKILGLEKEQYERLTPEQLADEKTLRKLATFDIKKDEALKKALNDMNPHFSYIFGGRTLLFGAYLNSQHSELEFYFIRTSMPDPPDYLATKDSMLKDIVREKFHSNPNYKIFEIDKGKVRLRKNIPNIEAIKIIKCILLDLARVYEHGKDESLTRVLKRETESLMPKLDEIERKLEIARQEYVKIQSTPISSSYDSEQLNDLNARKELHEKVRGTKPLFD